MKLVANQLPYETARKKNSAVKVFQKEATTQQQSCHKITRKLNQNHFLKT